MTDLAISPLATGMFSLDTSLATYEFGAIIPMQSPDGNQLWIPGQSLWSLIVEHVPDSGLPKIHTALGHSLVDMYTEVHTEAERWHKLWQESQQGNNWSRAGTPLPRQQAFLADPPVIKELVRAEVKMLLQSLREKASIEGRDGDELLFRYKPESVHYALSHLDSCYRNRSSPGDADNESRPSSRCSVQSSAEDEIEAMRDKLNVTDIEQVVERLRSILLEECEALNRLVKHFKGSIKQKCRSQCEFDKSEPTLADLKELRGALQMDLKLYPSSLAASPSTTSPLRLKELKNRLILSAGPRVPVSDETKHAFSTTSALRPNPAPPPSHAKPRPPLSAPPNKNSASLKVFNSSSLSHRQQRSTSASTAARKTQTTIRNRSITPGHASSHYQDSLSGPGRDEMLVKTMHPDSFSLKQDAADLYCRPCSPSFPTQIPRDSTIRESPLSSHRSIHNLSRKCDPLLQTERTSSPVWSSRNISAIPTSPGCDAGRYSDDHSVSTTGISKTQNGRQNSSCRGSLVSATAQQSFQSETPAKTISTKSSNRTEQNKNGHPGKDVTQQPTLVTTRIHPTSTRINGQWFTSPKRPLEGATSQTQSVQEAQTELEFISKFYQPVPPARVST